MKPARTKISPIGRSEFARTLLTEASARISVRRSFTSGSLAEESDGSSSHVRQAGGQDDASTEGHHAGEDGDGFLKKLSASMDSHLALLCLVPLHPATAHTDQGQQAHQPGEQPQAQHGDHLGTAVGTWTWTNHLCHN